jgi:hypothetical protein
MENFDQNKCGFIRFLRDVSVNVIGVLIAACISIYVAFYVYDQQNKDQCNRILEMIIEETALNEGRAKNILERLNKFVAGGRDVQGNIFTIRLLSYASCRAFESELVTHNVPLKLRNNICAHCENLRNVNGNLGNFNDYLASHIDDQRVNLGFLKKWAEILINGVNARCEDGKNVANQIAQYLNET